jgi:hypothetical protein
MYQKKDGLDGISYDSHAECDVADFLYLNGVEYIPHKKLPPPSRQKCDFFLPKHGKKGLWLEYDGLISGTGNWDVRSLSSGGADVRRNKKYDLYEKLGLEYAVITREKWKDQLYEVIFSS